MARERAARAGGARARPARGLDPRTLVGELSEVEQALVAIARALQELDESESGVLVLDEPTASLPRDGVAQLFARHPQRDGGWCGRAVRDAPARGGPRSRGPGHGVARRRRGGHRRDRVRQRPQARRADRRPADGGALPGAGRGPRRRRSARRQRRRKRDQRVLGSRAPRRGGRADGARRHGARRRPKSVVRRGSGDVRDAGGRGHRMRAGVDAPGEGDRHGRRVRPGGPAGERRRGRRHREGEHHAHDPAVVQSVAAVGSTGAGSAATSAR